jgi:molybdopterin synthase catalytic subunit
VEVMSTNYFEISSGAIDVSALKTQMAHQSAGAFVSFEGWVRDHHDGKSVLALDYRAHPSLAQIEGQAVMQEATAQFALLHAICIHRIGKLELGDLAVWVGVSSAHRDSAFQACHFIIDAIKARVPIWKHEHYQDDVARWLHP